MAIIKVEYTVPVLCTVDTTTGEIVSVTEEIEHIDTTGRYFTEGGVEIIRGMNSNPFPAAIGGSVAQELSKAKDIAEGQDWPEWGKGS